MIDGVQIHPLKQIPDERGKIMHVLRCDAPHFERFGEVYVSVVEPGAIKAWHCHRVMGLNYAVPVGKIKLVLHDDREGSPTKGETQEIYTGPDHYALIHVPPLVWNGFKGVATVPSYVINCATHPHDPDEIEREDPFTPAIGYDWSLQHG